MSRSDRLLGLWGWLLDADGLYEFLFDALEVRGQSCRRGRMLGHRSADVLDRGGDETKRRNMMMRRMRMERRSQGPYLHSLQFRKARPEAAGRRNCQGTMDAQEALSVARVPKRKEEEQLSGGERAWEGYLRGIHGR
eukprot:6107349-Pyramimonas_sp.AAC.1